MSLYPTFSYAIINIRLQANLSGVERTQRYIDLVKQLADKKVHVPVAKRKHVMLYNYYERETDKAKIKYLYGSIGKGFHFEKAQGLNIDIERSKREMGNLDTTKIFDASATEYIFIPTAHRFCFQLNHGLAVNDVIKFLQAALDRVITKDEKLSISIENEPVVMDEILNAKALHSVNYVISYTNDDVVGATGKLFDARLKRHHIGKLEVKAQADYTRSMIPKGEELLEGGVQLARSNGEVKRAVITDANGKKKTVSSKEKPLIVKAKAQFETWRNQFVASIYRSFRPTSSSNDGQS